MEFKEKILENQKELKEIYATEIERVGGINIWEKINGKEQNEENKSKPN